MGENRPVIGLAAEGVINPRAQRTLQKGYMVVGQLEHNRLWCTEGYIEFVCEGKKCFVDRWTRLN